MRVGHVVAITWVGLSTASNANADQLDRAAFSASPADLLAAAQKAPSTDAEVDVLRDETSISFDASGRSERRTHIVFAIRKQVGVEDWGTLELDWRPFYQDKPIVNARVVAQDGRVVQLDASLVTDTPAVTESPVIFSDRRELNAPLPRLEVGSVVEEEIVVKDREPLSAAGVRQSKLVGRTVPVRRTLLTISAPTAMKARVLARGFAKTPAAKISSAGGRTTWSYDIGPLDARKRREDDIPSDVFSWTTIAVSTAPSWSTVAADYRKLVDRRLAEGPVQLDSSLHGKTPRETVEHIVAWMHAHVRYTGIEFSDAEIVPWAPSEVVKRGFGDCKDKASLLVALLRAAGMRADIALLWTGPGQDIDRDLPGMGGFDHAIVRARVDGKDLWIDATESDLPVGVIPARDEGRLALVAADDTRELVLTPKSSSTANVIREVRTYHVSENGRATVTEVSSQTGLFFDDLRGWVRERNRDDIQKNLQSYVDREYRGKLTSFTHGDPSDIAHPFELTLEVADSPRVFTARRAIDAYLYPSDVFAHLPKTLDNDDADARTNEFEWSWPHVYEIENHFVVPSGFTMPQLTPHEEQQLGSISLTTDRRVDQGSIVIAYRLDTGKLRLTPAEVLATRTAIRELRKREREHVVIAHTAWDLLHQGKTKEAIAELQRLIALHPKEALHWDQLADVYRECGMGAAARRSAKKAIEVEPTSSDAYHVLAFQLRRDSLGRDDGFDMDRPGAIHAYRKALELNPKHIGALADFASLLTMDDKGRLSLDRKARIEAIELWRRAKVVAEDDKYDGDLAKQLLFADQAGEAERIARSMPESKQRSQLLIAATAVQRGAAAAMSVATTLATEQERKRVVSDAVGILVLMRRYDVARELFNDVKDADTDANQAALIAQLAVVDPSRLDPGAPRTPVLKAFLALLGDEVPGPVPWDADFGKDVVEQAEDARNLPEMRMFRVLPTTIATDMMAALLQTSADGSAENGWIVTIALAGLRLHYYVISEHGKAKVIGASGMVGGLGPYLLAMLSRGDVRNAARWTKSIVGDLQQSGPKGRLDALAKAFKDEEARSGSATPSKDLIEITGALLTATRQPKAALPILQRCAAGNGTLKSTCQRGLTAVWLESKDWVDAAAAATALFDGDPTQTDALGIRAVAFAQLGRIKEATKLIDDALAKHGDDLSLIQIRALVALAAHDWDDARTWFDKALAHPEAGVVELNNIAWAHLFFDSSPIQAREIAARGERMEKSPSAEFANTLAAIEAESDRPYSAWTYLQKSIARARGGVPSDSDWYVFGRIAESYGLRDDAIAAYRRVHESTEPQLGPTGYDFAQRGLARLHAR